MLVKPRKKKRQTEDELLAEYMERHQAANLKLERARMEAVRLRTRQDIMLGRGVNLTNPYTGLNYQPLGYDTPSIPEPRGSSKKSRIPKGIYKTCLNTINSAGNRLWRVIDNIIYEKEGN